MGMEAASTPVMTLILVLCVVVIRSMPCIQMDEPALKHVLSIMEAVIGLARIPRQGYDAVAQLDLPCSLMGKRAKILMSAW